MIFWSRQQLLKLGSIFQMLIRYLSKMRIIWGFLPCINWCGRVGRSNRVAYAYFMYEQQKILNEVSEKRLQAIKDFTELGSRFKIAMRDLSIRGAGNLLGSQQHGFIDSVGFDMYSQIKAAEAVNRKQGKNTQLEKTMVEIDLGLDAYLPTSYIEDERQKIEIYKRIRELDSQEYWTSYKMIYSIALENIRMKSRIY